VAAAHALAFLDGLLPVTAGSRLELSLPDLAWVPEAVEPHPACVCGAAGAARGTRVSAACTPHATMSV
jgi:hypothetical protein